MVRTIYTCLFVFLMGSLYGQNGFSREQIINDLNYLKKTLEEVSYDLYAYTSKEAFEKNFNQIVNELTEDSLSQIATINLFQKVVSAANIGHTSISFPGQQYIAYAYDGGTVFPLEIALESGQALIRKNWSSQDDIKIGDELVSIDGVAIQEILDKINPLIAAERPYFKQVKIEAYSLPRLYWQLFGRKETFEVEIRSGEKLKKYVIKAVEVIDGFEAKRTEVLNAELKLDFFKKTAYLNPGSFNGDETKYRAFIDSAFNKINELESDHLIIDLRNSQGGDDSYSDYLVSYIADQPFTWSSQFTLKTSSILKEFVRQNYDTTTTFWQSVLNHENGEIYEFEFEPYQPQPEDKRFTGQVYVLVNRQSHSQAAVTASQIQDYNFGIIVGEETGDYPSLYASIFQFTLPNTSIPVNVTKGRIIRVNGSEKEEGVIPDILIKDHLLDENDEILNALLKKLEGE